MDCLRQASQNKCPHFVDTKLRPDLANFLLLSMQIGQVMSGELEFVRWGARTLLVGGVEGKITTSLSSDSDKQTVSFRHTLPRLEIVFTDVRSMSETLATGEVKSTTTGSSFSVVRSTTLCSSSACPSESVLPDEPVGLSDDDTEIGRLERSRLNSKGLVIVCKLKLQPSPTYKALHCTTPHSISSIFTVTLQKEKVVPVSILPPEVVQQIAVSYLLRWCSSLE